MKPDMNRFLAEVETKAFHMARYAVKDNEEALDIVQEAMFTLVRKYAGKPAAAWRPLFFKILHNRILDWHRRSALRRKIFREPPPDGADIGDLTPGPETQDPMVMANLDGVRDQLQSAIEELPVRQQQAFLLRALEGLKTREAAQVMGCSEGSVKTHYSRAVHRLRGRLQEHWE